MERGWLHRQGFLLCLIFSLPLQGQGAIFTISHSGFDQRGVDPVVKQYLTERLLSSHQLQCPHSGHPFLHLICHPSCILVNAQLQLVTLSLWLNMIWYSLLIRWNPEEYGVTGGLSVVIGTCGFQVFSSGSLWMWLRHLWGWTRQMGLASAGGQHL